MRPLESLLPSWASTPERLTGTTSQRSAALTVGRMASVFNGEEPITVVIGGGAVTATATTGIILGPWARFDWQVETGSEYVAAFPLDGTSTFDCRVLETSPGNGS